MADEMSELGQFVSRRLLDIVLGVADAQAKAASTNAVINPAPGIQSVDRPVMRGGKRRIQEVEFDVAVTKSEDSSAGGGLKIAIPMVNIGGGAEGSSARSDSRLSRVKFSIGVALPAADPADMKSDPIQVYSS